MDLKLKARKLLTFVQTIDVFKTELEEQLSKVENSIGDLSEIQDVEINKIVSDAIYAVDKIHESLKIIDELITKAKPLSGEKR
jgi:hypothetical protein